MQEEAIVDEERNETLHGLLVGQYTKRRRDELGITQEELAERMGNNVTTNWITQLETGRKRKMLPQPYFGWLAEALAISEDDLLRVAGMLKGGDDAPSPYMSPVSNQPSRNRLRDLVNAMSEDEAADTVLILRAMTRMRSRSAESMEPQTAK